MDAPTVWLYFFSSVFQGNAALLALIGVFMVFMFQARTANLSEESRTLSEGIFAYVRGFMSINGTSIPVPISSVKSLRDDLANIVNHNSGGILYAPSKAKELLGDKEFNRLMVQYAQLELEFKRTTVRAAVLPSVATLFVIIGSLVALPNYCEQFSILSLNLTARCLIWFTILCNIVSLALITRFVYRIIARTQSEASMQNANETQQEPSKEEQ